jgi:hypothetical protein
VQVPADGFQHVARLGEYLFVAESHDGVAESLEEARALEVRGNLLLVPVVFAVDFDDESVSAADEVDDVGPDGILASEVLAAEPVCSEVVPETSLGER